MGLTAFNRRRREQKPDEITPVDSPKKRVPRQTKTDQPTIKDADEKRDQPFINEVQ